jgi:hypothetical protein
MIIKTISVLLLIGMVFLSSCTNNEVPTITPPEFNVVTLDITKITSTTARVGGECNRGTVIRGFQWGDSDSEKWVESGNFTSGIFHYDLENLISNHQYNIRVMVWDGADWVYGNELNFTTVADVWYTYPQNIEGLAELTIYPSSVMISNIHSDSLIDTWTEDRNMERKLSDGEVEILVDCALKKGDWQTVNIINWLPTEETYQIAFRTPDSQYNYHPESIVVKQWVQLSVDEITIPPYAIAHVPMRIIIPQNVVIPETEFWIDVYKAVGMVQAGASQRWIIVPR